MLVTIPLNKIKSIKALVTIAAVTSGVEDQIIYPQAIDGGMFIWKPSDVLAAELLTAAEISARLADYCRRERVPCVLVRGDQKPRFSPPVVALDAVRLASIARVSVKTLVTARWRQLPLRFC